MLIKKMQDKSREQDVWPRDKYATLGSLYELKCKRKKRANSAALGSTTNRLIKNAITFWSYENLFRPQEPPPALEAPPPPPPHRKTISACVNEVTKCALHILYRSPPPPPLPPPLPPTKEHPKKRVQRHRKCVTKKIKPLNLITEDEEEVQEVPMRRNKETAPGGAEAARLSWSPAEVKRVQESVVLVSKRFSVPTPKFHYCQPVKLQSFSHLLEGLPPEKGDIRVSHRRTTFFFLKSSFLTPDLERSAPAFEYAMCFEFFSCCVRALYRLR
jgi:hypothetical protein